MRWGRVLGERQLDRNEGGKGLSFDIPSCKTFFFVLLSGEDGFSARGTSERPPVESMDLLLPSMDLRFPNSVDESTDRRVPPPPPRAVRPPDC